MVKKGRLPLLIESRLQQATYIYIMFVRSEFHRTLNSMKNCKNCQMTKNVEWECQSCFSG